MALPDSILCETCADIFRGTSNSRSTKTRSRRVSTKWTFEKLEFESSRCTFCYRLWKSLLRKLQDSNESLESLPETLRILRQATISHSKELSSYVDILCSFVHQGELDLGLKLRFVMKSIRDIPISDLHSNLGLEEQTEAKDDSTGSAKVLALASTWLRNCVSTHLECQPRDTCGSLPTRLLEIGKPSAQYVRLVETSKFTTAERYMTLSHCWGTAQIFQLTELTYAELCSGVPITKLALSFQHAIIIAERLGVGYLWIDCLCIIQKCQKDWQHESSMMGSVYQGSFCNIVAAASSDSGGGCFRQRESRFLKPCLVTSHWTDLPNSQYLLEHREQEEYSHDTCQPVSRRAWILQELLLAPRVLHFGSEYIFWECCRLKASEVNPQGTGGLIEKHKSLALDLKKAFYSADLKHYPPSWRWREIVKAYTATKLTEPGDKLVAISGIARRIPVLGSPNDFFAGLWRHDMVNQFMWESTSGTSFRPKQYRAPSWSWASVEGEVRFKDEEFDVKKTMVEVIDVQKETVTDDEFGQVRQGTIWLKGSLKLLSIKSSECKPVRNTDGVPEHSVMIQTSSQRVFLAKNAFKSWSYSDDDLSTSSLVTGAFYFMPVLRMTHKNNPLPKFIWEEEDIFAGLVLRPTGFGKGQFSRAGILQIWPSCESRPWLIDGTRTRSLQSGKLVKQRPAIVERVEDELKYQSFDGSKYLISIV